MTGGKRKRGNNAIAENDKNENSNDELNSKVESLQKNVTEILGKLQILNETKKNEDNKDERTMMKVHEELEELKNQQKLILEELRNSKNSEEQKKANEEKKSSFNSVISPGSLVKNTPNSGIPAVGRSFVLKYVFEDVSKMEERKNYHAKIEDHFGVPWSMHIVKEEGNFGFYLQCNKSSKTGGKWAIDTQYTRKFIGVNGNTKESNFDATFENPNNVDYFKAWGCKKFLPEEVLKKDYLVDDKLSAEIHVKINKMTGVYKDNLRCFDETMKNYSDVVLKVKDRKFYVLKLYLATHSSYFDSLFLGSFIESNKSEIELTGIEPEDFQNFLEVLYMKPAVDEVTVEGILLVADMYDTSDVIEKCEDFLIEKSRKSIKKKLQLAFRYRLDKLKTKCMSEIKTIDDIKSIISGNLEDLEPLMTTELIKKLISL